LLNNALAFQFTPQHRKFMVSPMFENQAAASHQQIGFA